MEELFIVLAIAAVIALAVLLRGKASGKTALESAAPVPGSMEQELLNRMEEFLEMDLFTLVIQPVVDFRDDSTFSGEVLSRMHHPERGVVFPDEFLPAVDARGLYSRFDRYIFRKSCAWLRRTAEAGERFDFLSCNFSRKTLSEPGLAGDLIRIAGEYGVPRHKLGLEITEREKETDTLQLLENLRELKAAGFRIILDDYGNGAASADELNRYPLDIVKIDRSMLVNACTEKGSADFRVLVTTAVDMGVEVVCEGIETEEQNRFARASGCHYGQGFLFFKPMNQDRIFEMMRRGSILDDDV